MATLLKLEPLTSPDHDSLSREWDIVIIGGGVAGLSAAVYAARSGHSTLVLEGTLVSSTDYPGGQLMLTPSIENYPGFASGSGADLIEVIRNQALSSGAVIVEERATSVEPVEGASRVHTDREIYRAQKTIIATGSIARRLGIPGEDELFGRGVSSCATCDGPFFSKKDVVVIGGGDVAVEDALFMTNHASHVYLVHRRDQLRSKSPAARALLRHPDITVIWNAEVIEVLSEERDTKALGVGVKGVRLSTQSGEVELPVAGVFVAIGHDPQSEVCQHEGSQIIDLDGYGYIKADGVRTNVPGVFVAGDVADPVYRQAITAAATGAMAGMEASRELDE